MIQRLAPVRRRARRLAGNEDGVTAIEFSLVVPVFLLIVYGILELGRLLFAYNSLGHAVYEAGRYAIVRGSASASPASTASTADIEAEVANKATSLDAGLLSVNVAFTPDNSPGSTVSIAATYQFQFMTTLLPLSDFDLYSETEVVIAR